MDLATAYQTLGLRRDAPADDIKARYRLLVRRYHPDVRGTGNSQKFILINAAYTLVLDALHGRKPGEELRIPDEVVSEAAIERKISGWFTALWGEYQSFRDSQVRRTKEHISRLVQGAASGLDLKNRVKKDIEVSWVEMGRKIEDYVGRLIRKAANEDQEFLYNLFRDMYEVRKEHWLKTLYRNPVVVIALFVFIVLTVLPHYPGLDRASPLLFAMASTPWLSFAPIQGLVLYMLFKLWVLNPKNQFIPPRLSLWGIHTQMREVAQGIGASSQEGMAGGMAVGGITGFHFGGPPGALIGIAVGGVWGLLTSEPLSTMKQRVTADLEERIRFSLQELDERMEAWLGRQKADLAQAAAESYKSNLKLVTRLLFVDQRLAKSLAGKSALLLPAPGDAPASRKALVPRPAETARIPDKKTASAKARATTPGVDTSPASAITGRGIPIAVGVLTAVAFGVPIVSTLTKSQSVPRPASSQGAGDTSAVAHPLEATPKPHAGEPARELDDSAARQLDRKEAERAAPTKHAIGIGSEREGRAAAVVREFGLEQAARERAEPAHSAENAGETSAVANPLEATSRPHEEPARERDDSAARQLDRKEAEAAAPPKQAIEIGSKREGQAAAVGGEFGPAQAARERAEAAQAAQLRARAEAERQRQLAAQISAEFDAAERDAKRPKPYEVSPGNWTCPRGYLLREGKCLSNDEIENGPRVEYGLPGP